VNSAENRRLGSERSIKAILVEKSGGREKIKGVMIGAGQRNQKRRLEERKWNLLG